MYARTSGERELTFDFGRGLVNDNLLIVDRETNSVWSQLGGKAIAGELRDTRLVTLPTLQTTWAHWRALHPTTRVLTLTEGDGVRFEYDAQAELGVGIASASGALFVPLSALDEERAVVVGERELVVKRERDANTAWVETAEGEQVVSVLTYRRGWLAFHPQSEELARPDEVRVHFIANEGFLLVGREASVVIDAFVREPYVGYGAAPAEVLDRLIAGEAPFESVRLALASHVHRDHFQPAPAAECLEARPDVLLASSPQVIDALPTPFEHTRRFLPEPGASTALEHAGARVEFLNLSHGTGRFAEIQNLGHVITLDGVTFLHVGDAAMEPKNFAPYDLGARAIDVAFVPYWYFGAPAGLRIVESIAPNATLVACHVPPSEVDDVTRFLTKNHPDVLLFRASSSARGFAAQRR